MYMYPICIILFFFLEYFLLSDILIPTINMSFGVNKAYKIFLFIEDFLQKEVILY